MADEETRSISRRPHQPYETFEEQRKRADEQAIECRREQNRLNGLRFAADKADWHDEQARKLLGRMRRKPNEIDPEGRWR